jgi:hypothetical protein
MGTGRGSKKISDDELIAEYAKLNNVWKVAEKVGMCGQSVHERLVKLGKIHKMNVFTEEDRAYLRKNYFRFKNQGKLEELAKKMKRTKQFICRQAKALGLTDMKTHREYAQKEGSNPYARYHARVRSLRGSPHQCEVCGISDLEKFYDWANLTGHYEDPQDYKRMCKPCHRDYDKSRVMRAHLTPEAA